MAIFHGVRFDVRPCVFCGHTLADYGKDGELGYHLGYYHYACAAKKSQEDYRWRKWFAGYPKVDVLS